MIYFSTFEIFTCVFTEHFYLCSMFRQKVIQYINEKHLFHRSDKILVALSGGADSVALLRVLLLEGYNCVAAHCNFHLRGEESDWDEEFVQNLCRGLDVPLQVIHFDTNGYASRKRISIEMAARELRYEWFEQVRLQVGASVIAVAHHRDDSVETFLLNLVRGQVLMDLRELLLSMVKWCVRCLMSAVMTYWLFLPI